MKSKRHRPSRGGGEGIASRYLFDPDAYAALSARIVGQDALLDALHDVLHVVSRFSTGQRPCR